MVDPGEVSAVLVCGDEMEEPGGKVVGVDRRCAGGRSTRMVSRPMSPVSVKITSRQPWGIRFHWWVRMPGRVGSCSQALGRADARG
jgi:hypothetical protein